jgi:hypothetical protein
MYTSDNRPLFPMNKRELAFFITLSGFIGNFQGNPYEYRKRIIDRTLMIIDDGFEALEKQPEPPKP